jgi:hypothetical protein
LIVLVGVTVVVSIASVVLTAGLVTVLGDVIDRLTRRS